MKEKKVLNKFVGDTSKLKNMLLLQQGSSCKLGHGGKKHEICTYEPLWFKLKILVKYVLSVDNKAIYMKENIGGWPKSKL